MIRTLLATTAIATLLASGAVAQTTAPADPTAPAAQEVPMTIHAEGNLASNLIGESVYNSTGEDAEKIGEIADLVIDPDGNVEAIIVGVGGFLGIGQKQVALEYDLAQWSEQPDGERWLVVETTEDALRAQQEFDRAAFQPMPADADVAVTKPATQEDLAAAPTPEEGAEGTDAGGEMAAAPTDEPADDAATDMAAAPTDQAGDAATDTDTAAAPTDEPADDTATDMAAAPTDQPAGDTATTDTTGGAVATAPATDDTATDQDVTQTAQQDQPVDTDQTQTGAIDRSTLQEAPADQISAENLTGTTVYGANEENVGEIGDVILTPEGQVDSVIVDVGGFLGIGEKEVAIGMDNLAFMTDENGELYLYTEFTQEELEAQPAYDESTYAEQRDEMRMQVQ